VSAAREAYEVRLELLANRRVLDADGRPIGRLEEIHAERVDLECLVREYVIGPAALFERLGAWAGGLRLLGGVLRRFDWEYRIPWELVDLADPRHPRVRARRAELERYRHHG
jgi:sporulation protein YlmC with PRC-barrel domain